MVIDRIDEPGDEDLKYYSTCCVAPPLYDVHYEEKYDAEPVGTCMKCREKAVFDVFSDEDPYEPMVERGFDLNQNS